MFFKCCGKLGVKSKTSQKTSTVIRVQTREQKITQRAEKALAAFEIEIPKARAAIQKELATLEMEFDELTGEISRARAPENKEESKSIQRNPNFNANNYAGRIFTLKVRKCDQTLNPLYYDAINASDEVATMSCWLREIARQKAKEDPKAAEQLFAKAAEWVAKHEEMAKRLRKQCLFLIKNFSEKVRQLADDLEIEGREEDYLEFENEEALEHKSEIAMENKLQV